MSISSVSASPVNVPAPQAKPVTPPAPPPSPKVDADGDHDGTTATRGKSLNVKA